MVSMERELNKLFNDTNYNKENVIIREIWSIKLELQNFFWGVYFNFGLNIFEWSDISYYVLNLSTEFIQISRPGYNEFNSSMFSKM